MSEHEFVFSKSIIMREIKKNTEFAVANETVVAIDEKIVELIKDIVTPANELVKVAGRKTLKAEDLVPIEARLKKE